MRNTYDTKQKELILETIKKQKTHFQVKDIYDALNGKVGLTTIYRLIEKLEKEKVVNKSIDKDNKTYFEYLGKCDEDNHFYLSCDKCGKLTHIDCDCINELSSHVYNEHKFTLNKENIVIKGICEKCKKRSEE